jgi:hypothetical protein
MFSHQGPAHQNYIEFANYPSHQKKKNAAENLEKK